MRRTGDGVFINSDSRREKSADEIDIISRCGRNNATKIQFA